jgi:hypothetical protein
MLTIEKSDLMAKKSEELDTPLSLSCVAENLRMAALHFDNARNLLEQAALAFESNTANNLSSYIQAADKHRAHALQYSSIAEVMIEQ